MEKKTSRTSHEWTETQNACSPLGWQKCPGKSVQFIAQLGFDVIKLSGKERDRTAITSQCGLWGCVLIQSIRYAVKHPIQLESNHKNTFPESVAQKHFKKKKVTSSIFLRFLSKHPTPLFLMQSNGLLYIFLFLRNSWSPQIGLSLPALY